MKGTLYFRLLLFSILGALAISSISLYSFVRISDVAQSNFRFEYLRSIARSIERSSVKRPVEKINIEQVQTPAAVDFSTSLARVTGDDEASPKSSLWLLSESGMILSKNGDAPVPVNWNDLPKPTKAHTLASNETVLFRPKTFIMRLKTTPVTFLVSHSERSFFSGPMLLIQGIHAFLTTVLSVFIALTIFFFYMRRKSKTARKVLQRLEGGDLKARFHVKTFDQFGNLIGDFNRMADQIERLVKRVRDTETSRSQLLQELGHDLRTPMTSLRTSFETLRHLNSVMTETDREELFCMIDSDIAYFQELLDKLTIIATIDEAHFKHDVQKIDLASLLEDEIKCRQRSSGSQINWKFDKIDSSFITGDFHLITRLFKNAFDNASRYATGMIDVGLKRVKDRIVVEVRDDGPGLSSEALKAFGKRRERREIKDRDVRSFSLGLGSVIMRTIAEAHDGNVSIANHDNGGAVLSISFRTLEQNLPH